MDDTETVANTLFNQYSINAPDTDLIYSLPPWPEWNEDEIEMENWDSLGKLVGEGDGFFCDPLGPCNLPPSLKIEVAGFFRIPLDEMLIEPEDNEFDHITNLMEQNRSLFERSEALRNILETVSALQRLANVPLEGSGTQFIPPDKVWKPWHHVYSIKEAAPQESVRKEKGSKEKGSKEQGSKEKGSKGKGSKTPKGPPKMIIRPNPNRKYLVRLHYMGSWRKFTLDDRIPVDSMSEHLLPVYRSASGLVELWATLLIKAMLRVGYLSWKHGAELNGWSPMTCLTGWKNIRLPSPGILPCTAWSSCLRLLPLAGPSTHRNIMDSMKYACGQPPGIGAEADQFGDADLALPAAVFAVISAACSSSREASCSGISSCDEHKYEEGASTSSVLMEAAAVFPDPDNELPPPPPISPWKVFRWLAWAKANGLYYEHIPRWELAIKLHAAPGAVLPAPPADRSAENIMWWLQQQGDQSTPRQQSENSLSDWCTLENLLPLVSHLEAFWAPSSFLKCVRLEESMKMVEKPSPTEGRATFKQIVARLTRELHTRRCLYVLVDSDRCKTLLVCISVLTNAALNATKRKLNDLKPKLEVLHESRVVGELYKWRVADGHRDDDALFTIRTTGEKCALISLPPGLVALRMWLDLAPECRFSVFAQCERLEVLKEAGEILEQLSTGGCTLKVAVIRLNQALQHLARAKPYSEEQREAAKGFWEALYPQFGKTPTEEIVDQLRSQVSEALENMLVWEDAAVSGAAGELKTALEQSLVESPPVDNRGKPIRPKSAGAKSPLKTCTALPLFLLQETLASAPHLLRLYAFCSDLGNLLAYEDFSGTVSVLEKSGGGQWVPLVRYDLNHTRSKVPVPCLVTLSCNQPGVRLLMAETRSGRRIHHGQSFEFSSERPVTVLGAIRIAPRNVEENMTATWHLRVCAPTKELLPHSCRLGGVLAQERSQLSMKKSRSKSSSSLRKSGSSKLSSSTSSRLQTLCDPQPPGEVRALHLNGVYVPNTKSVVCQAIAIMPVVGMDFTLRVAVSNPLVKLVMNVTSLSGELIATAEGTGDVLMTALRSNETILAVEVSLKPQSVWPLTTAQLVAAVSARHRKMRDMLLFGEQWRPGLNREAVSKSQSATRTSSSSSVISKKKSVDQPPKKRVSINVERKIKVTDSGELIRRKVANSARLVAAWWLVTLVTDVPEAELKEDDRWKEHVLATKRRWEAKERGRWRRAADLRDQWLMEESWPPIERTEEDSELGSRSSQQMQSRQKIRTQKSARIRSTVKVFSSQDSVPTEQSETPWPENEPLFFGPPTEAQRAEDAVLAANNAAEIIYSRFEHEDRLSQLRQFAQKQRLHYTRLNERRLEKEEQSKQVLQEAIDGLRAAAQIVQDRLGKSAPTKKGGSKKSHGSKRH